MERAGGRTCTSGAERGGGQRRSRTCVRCSRCVIPLIGPQPFNPRLTSRTPCRLQSLISTTTHLFHAHPLSSLAASFLQLLTPLPPSFLSTLPFLLSREYHPTQPAHTLLAFLDRLAAKLAQFAHALAGQNRARQRRWVVKSLGAWGDVVREAEDHAPRLVRDVLDALGPALPSEDPPRVLRATEHLGAAVSAHVHELALEALLSGFEDAVGLFEGGAGSGGASEAWWVAKRLAARLVGLWERLFGTKEAGADGREYLESKRAEARAVEAVCATCWLVRPLPISARWSARACS